MKPHIEIEVDGDRAHGTWDILAPCTATDGTPMWMAGVEEDRYVREGGRWLHESMKLRVVFMAPHAKRLVARARRVSARGRCPGR